MPSARRCDSRAMLTFFSTPKPFRGHIGLIQCNAIRSWTRLHPEAEVILFGNEEGAAEAARELGIRHEPEVQRNEHGTKYLASIFDRAQERARHDLVCYVNCDIILGADFRAAVERVAAAYKRFLMVGRRWDIDITEPVDFAQPDWHERLRAQALERRRQRPPQWIDYFAFSRGLYHKQIPSFVIGRPGWDPWLVWHARASRVAVVDASRMVVAIHQNHDYSYHPDGEKGVWEGEEAQKNLEILGPWWRYCTTDNATHKLTARGIRRSLKHWFVLAKRQMARCSSRIWFGLLGITRPVRHALGLRQERAAAVVAGLKRPRTGR